VGVVPVQAEASRATPASADSCANRRVLVEDTATSRGRDAGPPSGDVRRGAEGPRNRPAWPRRDFTFTGRRAGEILPFRTTSLSSHIAFTGTGPAQGSA